MHTHRTVGYPGLEESLDVIGSNLLPKADSDNTVMFIPSLLINSQQQHSSVSGLGPALQ